MKLQNQSLRERQRLIHFCVDWEDSMFSLFNIIKGGIST